MNNKKTGFNFLFFFAILPVFLSACGYSVPDYVASAENVEIIRNIAGQPKKFKVVISAEQEFSTRCRITASIRIPDEGTYESYIQKAIISELKFAKRFSPSAPVTLRGQLERVDFSTSLGNSRWEITIKFSWNEEKPFLVKQVRKFRSSYYSRKACLVVAQAFQPTVRLLISKLFNHPDFIAHF